MSKYVEFRYGWPVVVSSALGIALGMSPLPFYTIGVFAGPLMQEFGWSISQVMSALAVFTVTAMITSPLAGMLTDRIGVRKVVLTSIVLFSLAMMSFALNNGSMTRYLLIWSIMSVCGTGTLPITFTRAVSRWFHAKRGLALGVALIGTGIAGTLTKLYAGFLIQEVGWRLAYVGVGALPLVIAFPVAYFLFHGIDDPKVEHRAKQLTRLSHVTGSTGIYGLTLGQAFTDWRFWLLAATFVPLSFAIGGPIPNLETILGVKGFGVQEAIALASIIGLAVFAGRLIGGYLLDHIWAPGLACVLLMLPALSMYLMQGDSPAYIQTVIAIALLGFAAGLEFDLLAYIISRYFGIRSYAAIYGTLYAFFAMGAGFGPVMFGKSYQETGSYDTIMNYAMWAFIICSAALLLLGRYRDEELKAMVDDPSDT